MLYGPWAISPAWPPCAQASELPVSFSLWFSPLSLTWLNLLFPAATVVSDDCRNSQGRSWLTSFCPFVFPSLTSQHAGIVTLQKETARNNSPEHNEGTLAEPAASQTYTAWAILPLRTGSASWCISARRAVRMILWHYGVEEWQPELPPSGLSFAAPTPVKGCMQECKKKSRWTRLWVWGGGTRDPWLFYSTCSLWAEMNAVMLVNTLPWVNKQVYFIHDKCLVILITEAFHTYLCFLYLWNMDVTTVLLYFGNKTQILISSFHSCFG